MFSLFNDKALHKRICGTLYDNLRQRARPRLWKSGRRKGMVRTPGLTALPFTREQLWQHVYGQIGEGVVRCPYCEMIGRNANLIDLTSFVLDHVVPVARGGGWTLDNLRCVCADCNNSKGKLTLPFFVAIMAAVERWDDSLDRTNFVACLRTHGVANRLRGFYGGKKKPETTTISTPETGRLALQEEF